MSILGTGTLHSDAIFTGPAIQQTFVMHFGMLHLITIHMLICTNLLRDYTYRKAYAADTQQYGDGVLTICSSPCSVKAWLRY